MTALLKVNGETIDAAAAVRLSILHNGTFLRDTIRNAVIRQYAEKQGIRNSDAELQLAADELRYNRGLEAVEAVTQWMRENHQTPLAIQDGIDAMLLNNKVRNAIAEEKLQAYYAEHKLEYEAAELYSIRVDSESKAKELLAQLNDEGANFHALAMEHSQDDKSRHLGGFVGRLTRSEMTGVVAAAVFAPRPAGRHRAGQDRTGMEPLQGREDSQADLRAIEGPGARRAHGAARRQADCRGESRVSRVRRTGGRRQGLTPLANGCRLSPRSWSVWSFSSPAA